ncbi:uncharacterized protein TRIVIDRAFT_70003 [Trichoderma virens Gv29-8]|uniref:Uncharacterized protein n=1 Tax=Hypocrea virens (strain Gv29-8 / FGSC 10586) TaxID=413071 RepID=G9MX59_HYPVG|nr:uncharacterized protein TRIVIDRAFT_70003 [Trichoderma virens Gv29-8]EHK20992.1 hypothetical protein TRIVIDRAFT_70003 [Trichoderma virens Gv29-8]UKZ52314.1 hypothetical protein TrVGV298_006089 [Trichoderma virens]
MPDIFCCSSIKLHPQRPDHEQKFDKFMQWAKFAPSEPSNDPSPISNTNYAFRLVKHVIFGQQESYFVPTSDGIEFTEITEGEFAKEDFSVKLDLYKNFRCDTHNVLFELNLCQQHPINVRQWRANPAQASVDVDLVYQKGKIAEIPSAISKAVKQIGQYADGFSSSGLSPRNMQHQSMLRSVLPRVKTNLGANPLLCLLSLDLINNKLKLGIEIEDLWKTNLNSDNIVTFLYEYAKFSTGSSVNIGEVEDVVGRAIRRTDLLRKEHIHGRSKFKEIVNQALDLGGIVELGDNYHEFEPDDALH